MAVRDRLMPHQTFLTVAGISLQFSSDRAEYLCNEHPAYACFLNRSDSVVDPFPVQLVPDSAPVVDRIRQIFDARPSWALWSLEQGGQRLVRRPPDGTHELEALWTADISDGSAVVYHPEVIGPTAVLGYPLDQFLIVKRLVEAAGILLHAAAVVVGGRGYVFAGRSGAGKSTISRLFEGDDRVEVITDDRCVLRFVGDVPYVFGTPWPGEGGHARYGGVPLGGLFVLEKGESERIDDFASARGLDALLPMISIPWYESEAFSPCLETLSRVLEGYSVRQLYFGLSGRAADFLVDQIAGPGGESP